jgi:hypothetical protein
MAIFRAIAYVLACIWPGRGVKTSWNKKMGVSCLSAQFITQFVKPATQGKRLTIKRRFDLIGQCFE